MTGDPDSVQGRHKSKLSHGGTRDCEEDDECDATKKGGVFYIITQ